MFLTPRPMLGLLASLLVSLPIVAQTPQPPPTKEQIARWIEDLGDNDFSTREKATKALWEAGAAAESALVAAVKKGDAEVVRRADGILRKFRWGIYPDTPPKIVEALTRYRDADFTGKSKIVQELFEQGSSGWLALGRIVRAEEDKQLVSRFFSLLYNRMQVTVPPLVAEGKIETLVELMDLLANADMEGAVGGLAVVQQVRGKLDEAIAQLRLETKGSDAVRARLRLVAFLRVKGDLPGALEVARQLERADLQEIILTELGDWKSLAALPTTREAGENLEELAYRAAFRRLARDTPKFEEALQAIRALGTNAPEGTPVLWEAAKVLMLNDRHADALALFARHRVHTSRAFDVLMAQERFPEALALTEPHPDDDPQDRLRLDAQRGRLFLLLGEKEKALALYEGLRTRLKAGEDGAWIDTFLEGASALGQRPLARSSCAMAIASGKSPDRVQHLLGLVFPGRGEGAGALWTLLRRKDPMIDPEAAMNRIHDLLTGKATQADLEALAKQVEETKDTPAERLEAIWLALADCALAARSDIALRAYLEKAANQKGTVTPLIRLGDFLAGRKHWAAAAEQYIEAGRRSPMDPLPLFLRGHALAQAGKTAEATRWKEAAHLLPLGDEMVRHEFATELAKRGHDVDAERERALVRALGGRRSYFVGDVTRQSAIEATQRKDHIKAADLHERAMLRCLSASVSFADPGAYVALPHYVHRHRARAHLAAGRVEEARREIALCEAMTRSDVDLAILLVPGLEVRGMKKEAEDLFERSFAFQEQLCRQYPRCAWAHNSLAWLAACCRRRLDEALVHSRKAVELIPDSSSYCDTLGEVYFQRGQRDEALKYARKSIELDPRRAYYVKQLKRIEAGNPKADLPAEGED